MAELLVDVIKELADAVVLPVLRARLDHPLHFTDMRCRPPVLLSKLLSTTCFAQ